MNNKFMGAALVVAVTVLFIGAGIAPVTGNTTVEESSMSTVDGNILYVGGSGLGNYTSIQDAIDNATSGDTVFVFNDSSPYYENVIVYKSIDLIGENKDTTIIDGGGNGRVVNISADGVTTARFKIINCGNDHYDAGIYVNSEANIITENIITNNKWYGLYLENSANNTIYKNSITNSDHCGIYLKNSCNDNVIHDNTLINHRYYGIHLSASSNNNIIYHNTVINNRIGINVMGSFNNIFSNILENEAGIVLSDSYTNTVTNNTFEYDGIYIYGNKLRHWNTHTIENNTANDRPIRYYKNSNEIVVPSDTAQVILADCTSVTMQNLSLAYSCCGIQLGFSSYNIILGNNIHNNNRKGIQLYSSFNNTIAGNNVTDNDGPAISLKDSSHNIVSGNTVTYNVGGIYLHCSGNKTSCTNNLISGNIVADNYGPGISSYEADHNIISSNTITKSTFVGIDFFFSSNNTIVGNNITDTDKGFILVGIYLQFSSNNNVISKNNIKRNSIGIFIDGNNNIIIENTFENNSFSGISMYYTCNSNKIYHNNFIRNHVVNVNTGENNTWDDGIGMGNYWDWYTGTDCDGDGIGDTPYQISGSEIQDRYPLMFPYGEEPAIDITTPEEGWLYIINFKIQHSFTTTLFGNIKIKANAANYIYGINRVEFYVDNWLRRTDTTPPYSWTWRLNSHIKHRHTIRVVAYDNEGNSATDEILVWKFF